MDTNYSAYLYYLLILVFVFTLLVVFLFKNNRPKKELHIRCNQPISSGNISVFFDCEENITIIAYSKDIFSIGRAVGQPFFMNKPYTMDNLGQIVRSAMSYCENEYPCSDSNLMKFLGFKGWKEFSKGKRNVSVNFIQGHGVVFKSTIRKPDGAYEFNYPTINKVISRHSSDSEIGSTLLNVLKRCIC